MITSARYPSFIIYREFIVRVVASRNRLVGLSSTGNLERKFRMKLELNIENVILYSEWTDTGKCFRDTTILMESL